MFNFPIGVMQASFRLGMKESIETAARIGVKGMQLYTTYGEYAPENFTKDKAKDVMSMMSANGLVFSALCGDFGKGFTHPELNPELIERSKRILDLTNLLGTDIVTTHIGVVPEDKNHEDYKIMQEACYELAQAADSMGKRFAVETGPEKSIVLKEFLDSLGSKGVSVNLDPANLVMVAGDDPVQAVYNLREYIVHTHAKDGVKTSDKTPEELYNLGIAEEEARSGKLSWKELPLGTGGVDWDNYLKALCDIGFRGFLTIERECGDNPLHDIELAVNFLNEKIRTL